ncbi:MAG TPA: hypothetical protein P5119_06895 [Candidatus Aminicenantes bacterium]|nr:hypothetical protein [Candidatus Aminicenantes bacterium]HRY65055.1 hypothetical protein [Candidatus Aminicenantes bacterium]HRZ71968.1 hypothetical protein [Candidatus Aminicenantes bacterium]
MDEMRGMTPADRAEAEAVERLLGETAAVRDEIRRAAEAVDWQALPALIADRALAAEDGAAGRKAGAPVRLPWPAALRMRPALAGLAAGLIVGAAAMYLALKAPGPRPGRNEAYYASGEFLDRAELEMARRGAVDYLEKSQYVLLDVFGSDEAGPVAPASVRMSQARDLLQKKKYLNGQLERFQMAKAKALCDQIEMLFLELSQIDDELPAAELGRIRGFVEERQLLLKINLVKKELESGV